MEKNISQESDCVGPSDWLCNECFNSRGHRQGKYQTIHNEVLEWILKLLTDNDTFMVKDASKKYKDIILHQHKYTITENKCESYRNTLKSQLESMGYKYYYPTRAYGSMYYDPTKFSDIGLEMVFNLVEDKTSPSASTKCVRTLIKRQAALFTKSINFDYRQLFGDDNTCNLDKYMDYELLEFVDQITKSERGSASRKVSAMYAHSRKMKCMMICSLLANTMDPSVIHLCKL